MSKTVLVVAAHSDDEALGCAGTIAKHVSHGDKVHVLFMTDGVGSRGVIANESLERRSIAEKSMMILGVTSMENLTFPDNKMDSVSLLDITQLLEASIEKIRPDIIYTHHIGDLNIDHQITHKAVLTASRPQPGSSIKEIYSFEVLSSTEWQTPGVNLFSPSIFVNITSFIDVKRKVLDVYCEEMRDEPHSRSVENVLRLCQLRGNCVGVEFAEAFMSIREIR